MQDRISLRRFVTKWLAAGDHQRALRIQPRSFRPVVTGVHHHATRKLPLYIKIPELHVAEAIVWVDGEVIGHRASGTGESSGDRQPASANETVDIRGVRRGVSKGRLKREVLDHGAVLRQVVVDSIARPHHRLLMWFPGNPDARREIVAVRPDERRRKYSIEGPGMAGQHTRGSCKTWLHVQIGDVANPVKTKRPSAFLAERKLCKMRR